MQITFYGAAREVTGSCSLLSVGGGLFSGTRSDILIDCGMFQGSDFNEGKNSDPLPFDAKKLSAVIVTHAHLDHTGRLPLLVRAGYEGHLYATPATIDLTRLILEDALEVMTYNHRKFGSPILYENTDIALTMQLFRPLDYYEEMVLPGAAQRVKIKFHDAGHIFGSAFVEIEGDRQRVVFSGDIGNVNAPILRATDPIPNGVDAVVCESTYGDRRHEDIARRTEILEQTILDGVRRGGAVMIPAFSLERTQELLYYLNELIDRQKRLPRVPIFLDSPLAIGATQVYRHFTGYYNDEAERLVKSGDDLFQFPGLTMTAGREESMRINSVPGVKIIIAGAGMMNGGRILHHAVRYLPDPSSTLLIIGYQAHGTVGREIIDGARSVRIMGERVPVKCAVRAIGAFSAHGDQEKLMDWIGGGDSLPKKVYLNHGEPTASEALSVRLRDELGVKATVVDRGLTVKV